MSAKGRYLLLVATPRLVVSVLSGAFFYLIWLVISLASRPYHVPLVRGVLWVLAPIATALGFATGVVLFARLRHLDRIPLRRVLWFPLIACFFGAAVVFPFGPMLIVFGMCCLGSLAMVFFEVAAFRRFTAEREKPGHGGCQ